MPDIVLADVGMPGKSGYEVARHVKHTPRLAHIPVLLLTGAFEPVDQRKASEAGCDGVLAKPFEPHLVIARVKELLERGRDGSAAPAPAPPVKAAPQPPAAPPAAETATDYFDRLDAALNKRQERPAEAAPPRAPAVERDVRPAPAVERPAPAVEREARPAPAIVREEAPRAGPAVTHEQEMPLSYGSPQGAFESPAAEAVENRAAVVAP